MEAGHRATRTRQQDRQARGEGRGSAFPPRAEVGKFHNRGTTRIRCRRPATWLLEALAEVRRERDEFRAALAELRAAVTARWEAEARLANLYRERAIARAIAVERDPNAILN